MKKAIETSIDNSIATYIAGGVFVQLATGLASDFNTSKEKQDRYFKNKLEKSAKEVEAICYPIHKFLLDKGKDITAKANAHVNKLVDLVSDISSLDDVERKRVDGILNKIKNDRRGKN